MQKSNQPLANMNNLIKLTKATELAEPIWVNPARIMWSELAERKKDKMKMTVIHLDGSTEAKIFVTEHPDQIGEQMLKIREIKIVL